MNSNENADRKPNQNLLILGIDKYGKIAKEIAELMLLPDGTKFQRIDFLDETLNSHNAIGLCNEYHYYIKDYAYAFPAFRNNEIRKKWLVKLREAGFTITNLIHPSAEVSPAAMLGNGIILRERTQISDNVVLMHGCILDAGVIIEEDSYIGQCSNVYPGVRVSAGSRIEQLSNISEIDQYNYEKNLSGLNYCFEIGV